MTDQTNGLRDYLEDHYAGATTAMELLESMVKGYKDQSLGAFASELLTDVQADAEVLEILKLHVGGTASGAAKQALGWLAEKLTRIKLDPEADDPLGTLETLETLKLGILGKQTLWETLLALAETDERVATSDVDFAGLIGRAVDQMKRVEVERLAVARTTLARPVAPTT